MVAELEAKPLVEEREAAECAHLMAASEPWLTLSRTFESSLAVLTDSRKETYVVRDSKGVAAFVILDMHGPFVGYIQTVCVRPDCRGQGLGTRLIEWAERRIWRESPNVFMCVSSFNEGAQRLYERLGYEVVGVLHEYTVPEHHEILLRKTKGPWAAFLRPADGPTRR